MSKRSVFSPLALFSCSHLSETVHHIFRRHLVQPSIRFHLRFRNVRQLAAYCLNFVIPAFRSMFAYYN